MGIAMRHDRVPAPWARLTLAVVFALCAVASGPARAAKPDADPTLPGGCDFVTGAHADALSDIASLQRITIEIDKYRKWVENGFRIVTSRSENIPAQFKKRFNADVRLDYAFGSCLYRAKLRQHGDLKDHVAFRRGGLLQSLDLKFKSGNIANAVRYKLFLEDTRSGADEILAAELLRRLGMLAPRTRRIEVVQNGTRLTMLLQETPAKEMLELQGRREGPLYEGDETLIFDAPNAQPFALEDLALARLVNGKWAAKGPASRVMALDGLAGLQAAYARYGNAKALAPRALSSALPMPRLPGPTPWSADPGAATPTLDTAGSLYWEYGALMLAMRASHGLRPHNRKFHWNALARRFEPLYYDGAPDPALPRNKYLRSGDARLWLRQITPATLTGLSDRLAVLDAQAFAARFVGLCGAGCDALQAHDFLDRVRSNLEAYRPRLLPAINATSAVTDQADTALNAVDPFGTYAERLARALPGSTTVSLIRSGTPPGPDALLAARLCAGRDCSFQTLPAAQIMSLAEGARLTDAGGRVLLGFAPQTGPPAEERSVISRPLPGTDATLRHSSGGKLRILDGGQEIRLIQSNARDWFVIENGTLGPIRVTLEGAAPGPTPPDKPEPAQRFNRYGLTGCLTFYRVRFDATTLSATGGGCEDAINLVSASGRIADLSSTGAMADAVDMDFSTLDIDAARIEDAGNDCLDLSAGRYRLGRIDARGCGDKALSVGEGSTVEVDALTVDTTGNGNGHSAEIGVSSKDSSTTTLRTLVVRGADVCMEAYRKKQEFFGGRLIVGTAQCGGGATSIGPESVLSRMTGQ